MSAEKFDVSMMSEEMSEAKILDMDTTLITRIITDTINLKTKEPCVFDKLRLASIHTKLKKCTSVQEGLLILSNDKWFIMKTLGLTTLVFDKAISEIKALC